MAILLNLVKSTEPSVLDCRTGLSEGLWLVDARRRPSRIAGEATVTVTVSARR